MAPEVEPRLPDCRTVQGLLSDLIDVRRGERPAPDISPLADPVFCATVERHLAGCQDCRSELEALEGVGAAYAEFAVGELPAEAFADYGRLVRERLARRAGLEPTRRAAVRSVPAWPSWLTMVGSSAAAALLAAALTANYLSPRKPLPSDPNLTEVATATRSPPARGPEYTRGTEPTTSPARPPRTVTQSRSGPTRFALWTNNGPQSMTFNPGAAEAGEVLRQLEQEMRRRGAVMLGELAQGEEANRGLLGLALQAQNREAVPEAPDGLAVVAVLRGSPAAKAGLQPGDYILNFDDLAFGSSTPTEILKLFDALVKTGEGAQVTVDYARWSGTHWILRRGTTVLGEYDK